MIDSRLCEMAAPSRRALLSGAGALFGYGFLRILGAPFRRRRREPATA